MDEFREVEKVVESEIGIPLLNISHWDSSREYQDLMMKTLSLNSSQSIWNYTYTYSYTDETRRKIKEKLGIASDAVDSSMILLLQSSTIAIVNICNLIKLHGYKKVCILQPAYFSVANCLDLFGVPYSFEYSLFSEDGVCIPEREIMQKEYDVLWITSPVFSTSVYYSCEQVNIIENLARGGKLVICDESLALPGFELVRNIKPSPNIISIYSPHKAISINGLKFSAIVCDAIFEDFLEQWVDVLSGALSQSNCNAISHYISDNFDLCFHVYKSHVDSVKRILQTSAITQSNINFLRNTHGHYISVFHNKFHQKIGMDLEVMRQIMKNAYASFFCGMLNGIEYDTRLSFRMNLTLNKNDLVAAFIRVVKYLDTITHTGFEYF
jgi:histidinol-phosphate/aromatic aminotransferase/cobyric acid decarboxylase-like protein